MGTYPHAAAMPTPAPYVTYPAANESTRLVAIKPTNSATAPTARIGRGPQRSSARPVMMLSQKNVNVVMPKMTAVALRSAPKSSLIDSKKAPKLYAMPSVTADDKNAATTVSHAPRRITLVGCRGRCHHLLIAVSRAQEA